MSDTVQFSALSLILSADPVVKVVMLVLASSSVLSWALAIETARRQAVVRQVLDKAAQTGFVASTLLDREVLAAGRSSAAVSIARETGGERLARVERAMREAARRLAGKTDAGLGILATIAAVAPFVGLLGTVWGVMTAFAAIAGANDTSLATVAPGIAEALFTTALGLFAAIPAVIAYNRLGAGRGRLERGFDSIVRLEAEALMAEPQPMRHGLGVFEAAAE